MLCQNENILHDGICQFVKVNCAKLCQDEDVLQSKSECGMFCYQNGQEQWMIICVVSK